MTAGKRKKRRRERDRERKAVEEVRDSSYRRKKKS